MKRVIIHCGFPKTGSSAIQAWLSKNHDYINEQGVFYPFHDVDRNNVSSGNVQALCSASVGGQWFFDEEKTLNMIRDFENSQYEILLLSSEYFIGLIQKISEFFPYAEFILYYRNPLDLFESAYKQKVKRNFEIKKFSYPSRHTNNAIKKINKIISFKGINLSIKPYAQELFFRGNIICDFLSLIDTKLVINIDRIVNPAYTLEALEFKRMLNHFNLTELDYEIDLILQDVDIGIKEYSLFSRNDYEKIKSKYLLKFNELDVAGHSALKHYIDWFSDISKPKPHHSQRVAQIKLRDIAEHFKIISPKTFNEVASIVSERKESVNGGLDFHKLFC